MRRCHGGETLPAVAVQTVSARHNQALTLGLRGIETRHKEQLGERPALFVGRRGHVVYHPIGRSSAVVQRISIALGSDSTARLPGRFCLLQLHPLVVPQDSQTKHDPAGRIRTPQVEQ
jgi:hypothetical protein